MSTESKRVVRVGSRKSELALIQTKYVISLLQELYTDITFEIHTMTTMGDRVLNVSLPKIGEKSLFTKDLEVALINGSVDFVVHSLKDLPTSLPDGMTIGAVLKREDPRDVLILNKKYDGKTLSTLPKGSIIGTSSLRRTAQLSKLYPHLEVCDIRGNLNTRLAKLDAENSKFAGIILAYAGLQRMNWEHRVSQILEPTDLLYAVGQGALAVECRKSNKEILKMLNSLTCLETQCIVLAERSFLKTLGGGCSAPVAVSTNLKRKHPQNGHILDAHNFDLSIIGSVWSLDGKQELKEEISCDVCLSDSEENIPHKRRRTVSTENEDDLIGDSNKKQVSPKVIHDKNAMFPSVGAGDSQSVDIKSIVNIHSDFLKKVNNTGNEIASTSGICPINLNIGQDVMGECPYLTTEQKAHLDDELVGKKCPITGETVKPSVDETDKAIINTKSKCPFDHSKLIPSAKVDMVLEKCPFLEKTHVKIIETSHEKQDNGKPEIQTPELEININEKFCGFYHHKPHRITILEKCEELGKTLANNLIKSGALDIMKAAQNEIRKNI